MRERSSRTEFKSDLSLLIVSSHAASWNRHRSYFETTTTVIYLNKIFSKLRKYKLTMQGRKRLCYAQELAVFLQTHRKKTCSKTNILSLVNVKKQNPSWLTWWIWNTFQMLQVSGLKEKYSVWCKLPQQLCTLCEK